MKQYVKCVHSGILDAFIEGKVYEVFNKKGDQLYLKSESGWSNGDTNTYPYNGNVWRFEDYIIKEGDKVKIPKTKSNGGDSYEEFATYNNGKNLTYPYLIVTEFDSSDNTYTLYGPNRENLNSNVFVLSDLELYLEEEVINKPKSFIKGDKVRIVKRKEGNTTGLQDWGKPNGDVGKEGYVVDFESEDRFRVNTVLGGDGFNKTYLGIFDSEELELVKEEQVSLNNNTMNKKFKNKLAIKGDLVLLEAIAKKLELIGRKFRHNIDWISNPTYILLDSPKERSCNWSNHTGGYTVYTLPQDWDKVLELAAEVEEEELKLEVGKWYRYTDSLFMFRYISGSIEESSINYSAGFNTEGNWMGESYFKPFMSDYKLIRLATNDEIKEALVKELHNRYKVGDYFISPDDNNQKRVFKPYNRQANNTFYYNMETDTLRSENGVFTYNHFCSNPHFYKEGKWVELTSRQPDIKLGEYQVEFNSDSINVGCNNIHVDHLNELYESLIQYNVVNASHIQAIKIRGIDIQLYQIKEIVEYFKNK